MKITIENYCKNCKYAEPLYDYGFDLYCTHEESNLILIDEDDSCNFFELKENIK